MKFNLWLEEREVDEEPIQLFSVPKLLENLETSKVGAKTALHRFESVQWGNSDGAIRVRVTPNFHLIIERLVSDDQGDLLWVVKRVYKVNTAKYAGKEDAVAKDVMDQVEKISKESLEAPVRDYHILHLVKEIANSVRYANKLFNFEDIKQVGPNNYNIMFSISGAGVGQLVRNIKSGLTPAAIVDVFFDENKGMIKTVLTTIVQEGESQSWSMGIPYFIGNFSPVQPIDEISQAVSTAFRHI